MANDYFQFKQFRITQDLCAMKVGTDGVLLGAWTDISNSNRILDIGTGTGVIALMLAQRTLDSEITALEIDLSAAQQASNNVRHSPFDKKIKVITEDIKNHNPENLYDLIVSNPPFFTTGTRSPNTSRNTARHDEHLNYSLLISKATTLLTQEGKLSVIIPKESFKDFHTIAEKSKLHLKRHCTVYPNRVKPSKRILLEYTKLNSELTEETLILEEQRHLYTDDAIKLFQDFYLFL